MEETTLDTLKAEAKSLGIRFAHNITAENLQVKINDRKAEIEAAAVASVPNVEDQGEVLTQAVIDTADVTDGTEDEAPVLDDVSGDELASMAEELGEGDPDRTSAYQEILTEAAKPDTTEDLPAREFTDVEPAAETGNITEEDLDEILAEYDGMRNRPENPISYNEYIAARGVITRIKKLLMDGNK